MSVAGRPRSSRLRRVHMFTLAAVMAGALGSIPAQAAGNADVYNFFAGEKAKATASSAPGAATNKVSDKSADRKVLSKSTKINKVSNTRRGKTARRKSGNDLPNRIAPAHLAVKDIEAETRHVPGRKALGYDAPSRERYRALIAKHAAENGLPFAIGDAVVRVESRYQPHVTNGGAVGLMQIKPRTARGLGFQGDVKSLMNPETNIKYGMKYLGQAYRLAKGDTCGMVMRYQSGHYAKRINRANLAYCAKVRTIVASLRTEVALAEVKTVDTATMVD